MRDASQNSAFFYISMEQMGYGKMLESLNKLAIIRTIGGVLIRIESWAVLHDMCYGNGFTWLNVNA